MPPSSTVFVGETMSNNTIPVWSRSIGSWKFSIARHPFAANELEDHYDKAADTWQATISRLGFEDAYAKLVDQVASEVDDAAKTEPLKVLDAGIGTGAMATAFALRCGHPIDLTGMDLSSEMLRQANSNLKKFNLTAHLFQGDLTNLPFADNTFDVVLVAHVLEHMAVPEVALAELCRVLKPGGVLIACVTGRSSAGAYIQLKWRTHRVDTETAVGWFRRCGIRGVRAVPLDRGGSPLRFSGGYVGRKAHEDFTSRCRADIGVHHCSIKKQTDSIACRVRPASPDVLPSQAVDSVGFSRRS